MSSIRPDMTPERIEQINALIDSYPDWNRSRLSIELCSIWDWRGENGQIKDISCRDVLRALDAAGKIRLPAQLTNSHASGGAARIELMLHDMTPVEGALSELTPLTMEVVTDKHELKEFKSYIEQYHYLGYDRNIGENIKYFVNDCHGRRLACLMFGSAAWACKPRDTHIGWSGDRRRIALKYMTNNSRFLIFPWIRVPHLASHVLGMMARRISRDWQAKYGHPLYCLETFVERDRFKGTCYKASNWTRVGETTGRGRDSTTFSDKLPIKDIYVYPLMADFRARLCGHDSRKGG